MTPNDKIYSNKLDWRFLATRSPDPVWRMNLAPWHQILVGVMGFQRALRYLAVLWGTTALPYGERTISDY